MARMRSIVNVHKGGIHRNIDIMVQWSIASQLL